MLVCFFIYSEIKKQGGNMTNEKIIHKVKACSSDADRINLIKKYANEMDGLSLGTAIGLIEDLNETLVLMNKYQFSLCLWGFLRVIDQKDSDTDKIVLIRKYAKEFDYKYLVQAIESIKSLIYLKEVIKEHYFKLKKKGILEIIIHRESDEDKKDMICEFANVLEAWQIGAAIGHINNLSIKTELIQMFQSQLYSQGILNVIGYTKSNTVKKKLVYEYADVLMPVHLGAAIGLIPDLVSTNNLIEKYQSKLGSEGILNAISFKKSDDDKQKLIHKYLNKLYPLCLGAAIGSINDLTKTKRMINKYKSKLGAKEILYIIKQKNDNDKIDLIHEYANTLKIRYLGRKIKLDNLNKIMKRIDKKIQKRCDRKEKVEHVVTMFKETIKKLFKGNNDTTAVESSNLNFKYNPLSKIKNFFSNLLENNKKRKRTLVKTTSKEATEQKLTEKVDNDKIFTVLQARKSKNKFVLNKRVLAASLTLVMGLSATTMALIHASNLKSKNDNVGKDKNSYSSSSELSNPEVKADDSDKKGDLLSNIDVEQYHHEIVERFDEPTIDDDNKIISIDDIVTVDADYIYTDVYKAKDRIYGLEPSFDNSKQRNIKGALVKIDNYYDYCTDNADLYEAIDAGGIVMSYVVGDENGYEGAYNAEDIVPVDDCVSTHDIKVLMKV